MRLCDKPMPRDHPLIDRGASGCAPRHAATAMRIAAGPCFNSWGRANWLAMARSAAARGVAFLGIDYGAAAVGRGEPGVQIHRRVEIASAPSRSPFWRRILPRLHNNRGSRIPSSMA